MPRIAQNRRAFALHDFKALDDAQGTFSGYLATFDNVDLVDDVIEQGAFAKTLNDARERKAAQNGAYLFPILYQHDDKAPCGGFIEAHEDSHGLYVKGQLDLDTQLGRETYSGLRKGYLNSMSIGYSPVKDKYKWVGDVRHLQEIVLYEGSIVTFPANPAAQVTGVKNDSTETQETPDASATTRMVKGSGGEIAVSADGTHAAYTGTHTHSHKAMGDQGDDSQHEHSHAHDGSADHGHSHEEKAAPQQPVRKARDFNTAFQQLAQSDQLQDDWGDTWQAIVTALSDVMWQAYSQVNYPYDGMETIDPVEAAQSNLDAFSAAVIDLVQRSVAANFVPCLDDDGDSFLDPDGPNADDDDAVYMGSMSANIAADVKAFRQRKHEGKAGRTISADNHTMMMKALDQIAEGHKTLSEFAKANDPANPGNEPPQQSDSVYDPGFGKGFSHTARTRAGARPARPHATTQKRAGATDGRLPHATTHDGDTGTTSNDDVAQFRALMASVRQGVRERAPVAG